MCYFATLKHITAVSLKMDTSKYLDCLKSLFKLMDLTNLILKEVIDLNTLQLGFQISEMFDISHQGKKNTKY